MSHHAFAEVGATPSVCFEELDSKGYVLVPSFLTPSEIIACRDDYYAADRVAKSRQDYPDESTRAEDAIDTPYKVRHVSADVCDALGGKVGCVARAVERDTTLRVNLLTSGVFGSTYFATDGDVGLGWHQDSVSYYAYQNHHDYLNFYIPIVKPARDKSNLCVVPFDALGARSPELCRKLTGGGASRFVKDAGKTIIHDNARGGRHGVLPYELDEIAATPALGAGDLLLLRGDVIHRTEDTDTERVALSLRMVHAQGKVRRSELLRGGPFKTILMTHLRSEFSLLFGCFAAAGEDELSIGELLALQSRLAPTFESPSRLAFVKFLFWNKLKARWPGSSSRREAARHPRLIDWPINDGRR
jgi:hypothetical protein